MNNQPGAPSAPTRLGLANPRQMQSSGVVSLGVVLAGVGLALGLAMALKRRETQCADGTFFPEGTTDYRCFVHPNALEGSAIAVIAVMLGLVIVLLGILIKSSLESMPKA